MMTEQDEPPAIPPHNLPIPEPCPWCGEEPEQTNETDDDDELYSIECNNDDCPVCPRLIDGYDTPEEATAAWNTRHEPHDIGWAVRQMQAGKRVRRASCPYMVFVFMDSADGPWLAQINGNQPAEAALLRHRHFIATDWGIAE